MLVWNLLTMLRLSCSAGTSPFKAVEPSSMSQSVVDLGMGDSKMSYALTLMVVMSE